MLIQSRPPLTNLAFNWFLGAVLLCWLPFSHAEMEELDDQTLEAQTGKEGITIDLSYKLSIGEIAWQFSDSKLDERGKQSLTPPPPPIEYVTGKHGKQ